MWMSVVLDCVTFRELCLLNRPLIGYNDTKLRFMSVLCMLWTSCLCYKLVLWSSGSLWNINTSTVSFIHFYTSVAFITSSILLLLLLLYLPSSLYPSIDLAGYGFTFPSASAVFGSLFVVHLSHWRHCLCIHLHWLNTHTFTYTLTHTLLSSLKQM